MKRGDSIELSIDKLAFEGKAIARVEGLVVFVEGAVPGDRVMATVSKAKQSFAEAYTTSIISPSPERVAPVCKHFGVCGGCSWQYLAYEAQVRWKGQHVREALEHVGGFEGIPVHDAIACAKPFFYRNKMEFSFSTARWHVEGDTNTDTFTLGMHVPLNYYKVFHLEQCHLQSEESNTVLEATRTFVREHDLSIYHNKRHDGYLRFLGVRQSATTSDFMVNLVTSSDGSDELARIGQSDGSEGSHRSSRSAEVLNGDIAAAYAEHLVRACPFVTTVVNNVTARFAQISRGESERVVYGNGEIREHLAGLEFVISSNSFFQTNTVQAEVLYGIAREYARLQSDDVVWDLYCGTGTIGISMARDVRRVVGIELVEDAIRDARRNAAHNGIHNSEFMIGDLLDLLMQQPPEFAERPTVVVVDPPRSGLHEDVVKSILAIAPERLVYVSCNPATLARDLALFREKYDIREVQPVDMFPHTWHSESVARLSLKREV
jgi:23S rRNA (uracil1939-C5)-methyltransferase